MKTEYAFLKFFSPIPVLTVYKTLSLFVFLLLLSGKAGAQTVCKDEMLANPWFDCGPDFAPVCACDNVTYRNQCAAYNNGGIQGSQWASGPCQDFYFFIYPSFNVNGTLRFWMQYKDYGRATLFIFDNYGSIKRQRQVEASNNFSFQFDIDVSMMQAGIYYLLVRGDKYQQLEKFVVLHP